MIRVVRKGEQVLYFDHIRVDKNLLKGNIE
mgnify:CR=1 FL=1